MAITLEEFVNIIGWKVDNNSLNSAEKKVTNSIKKIHDVSSKLMLSMTAPISGIAGFMVKLGSDATETANKFNEVFKGNNEEANSFAKILSDKTGRSIVDLQNGMSAYQSQMLGLGFGKNEALEMSEQLQQMTIDFGSFHNASDPESMQRFISAMSGSTESLDMFGINLKSSNMDLKLQELGLAKSTNTATEAQKAIARMSIIKDTLTKQGAMGDAVRTINEFANSSRRFTSKLKEVGIAFGQIIIPYLNKLMNKIIPILYTFRDMSSASKKLIVFTALFLAVLPPILFALTALVPVGTAVVGVFVALSSPIELATISAWGFNVAMAAIPIAIVLIIGLLALFIDDIINWVKGNNSMLGNLLGSWKAFSKALGDEFKGLGESIKNFFVKTIPDAIKSGLNKVKSLFMSFIHSKPVQIAMKIFKYTPTGMLFNAIGKGAEMLGTAVGGSSNIKAVSNNVANRGHTIVNRNKINVVVPDGTSQTQATDIVTGAINNASKTGTQTQIDLSGALYETQGLE